MRTRKPAVRREDRMNAGVVLHPRFGGYCGAIFPCKGPGRCVYRRNYSGQIPEHTCQNDPLQRWQCAISRLTWTIMRNLNPEGGTRPPPLVHPELVDYDALCTHVMEAMIHRGPDPDRPVVSALDYPNPRAYYGDDGRTFLRRVAESLTDFDGARRLSARQIKALCDGAHSLEHIARHLYQHMNGVEKRKFRQRLAAYTTTAGDVGVIAALLPDVPVPSSPPTSEEEESPVDEDAQSAWCVGETTRGTPTRRRRRRRRRKGLSPSTSAPETNGS